MHRTHRPLTVWFWAIYLCATDKRGISAVQLSRTLNICYESAWYLLHRIRRAMAQRDENYALSGIVEMDDGYVGGATHNGKRGRGTDKAKIVVALSKTENGTALFTRMQVVEDVTSKTLQQVIGKTVATGAKIECDGYRSYKNLSGVELDAKQYEPGDLHWLHKAISNLKAFLLGTYTDWRNMIEWPQVPGAAPNYQKMALKQGDPLTKPGIVGAFCRAYDIRTAMDKFLPGIYTPCIMGSEERYTYTGGSTAGGAIIYDNGKFLYSHHATDPCSMQLVNAFDLVRLHLYGDKDDSAPGNTPVSKLPSYKAMCEMALQDSAVQAIYNKEQFAQLQADFGAIAPIPGNGPQQTPGDSDGAEPVQGEVIGDDGQQTDPNAWLGYIQRDENGKIKQTIDNVLLILNNDPRLCGRFMLNEFSGRGEVLYPLPWDKDPDKFKRRAWADSDISAMYWYMEKGYKITKRNAIDAGLDIHAATHAFNEVQDFIKGLAWDGVPRLDTLFIDYLGADDSPYTRAVTRKAFVGAVARAMEPGCKFDNMLILCGPQGLGKSTLLDRMSKGWYNDSIRTFEGKEASELLQGVWLVEVAELDAFRKTDVSRIKQFLSLRYDRYRAAYGRNVKELPRCCVFFGTCNVSDFLQDTTGNRRFWPVDVGQGELIHRAWDLTDAEINQIWAEAKMRWMMGEPLFLTGDLADAARARQEDHREASVREGLIRDFVERDVPTNWLEWPLDKRRDYWAGACKGQDIPTMPRDRICAAEVWCELFNGAPRDIKQADTREINAVLASTPGWEANRGMKFGPYKQQRGYRRFNRQV